MLWELVVENYAVIDRIRVSFHPGLNLLTGETGSGKSIVVDALALLFGGRASPEMVRTGADRARISGIFEPPDTAAVRSILAPAGVETSEGELLIEREIYANGKSRAFVCNRPVTVSLLRDLGETLGDIHGQHDQQSLYSPAAQLALLDEFGGYGKLAADVAGLFRQWRYVATELEELDRTEQEKLRLADLWSFQKREIEGAELRAGEDAELEQERLVLKNIHRLQEAATAAYTALYDSPESAESQLRAALRKLEELARIDGSLLEAVENLRTAAIVAEETAHTLRGYLSKLESDPARLDQIEARLAAIEKLKRKYGRTIEEILRYRDEVAAQLSSVEMAAERRQSLRAERERLAAAFQEAAAALSRLRREAAHKLAQRVETELRALAMENTVFRVEFASAPWSATGVDTVQFLVSPNPGEEPKPLEKIASGGEISRIALALKTCAAVSPSIDRGQRTLVFDEIDAGIGGRAGEAVGRRLKRIAAHNQVLCVTHLPQVAAFADHHYIVEKRVIRGRTTAAIEELDAASRTHEIGRMLSGAQVTPEALKHAEQLLRLCAAE